MDERLIRHPLGFWQVKERPSEEALKSYYQDRYYQTAQSNYRPSYPADEVAWFHVKTERIADLIMQARGSSEAGTLLDVGCGEGFAMNWFDQRGWSVRGLDFSCAGIENMHPHLLDRLSTGNLFQLLEAEIEAGHRYDVLWLANVLEHVLDPLALLSKLHCLVERAGVLAVTVPNDASAWQEFLYQSGKISERFWIGIPDHLSYFDAASLRAAAEATGWTWAQMTADFPIDWFLGNAESEYVSQKTKGRSAHQARIDIDTVLARLPVAAVNQFYTALANVGMGRQLTAILKGEPR